jgi:hypothetical protein
MVSRHGLRFRGYLHILLDFPTATFLGCGLCFVRNNPIVGEQLLEYEVMEYCVVVWYVARSSIRFVCYVNLPTFPLHTLPFPFGARIVFSIPFIITFLDGSIPFNKFKWET